MKLEKTSVPKKRSGSEADNNMEKFPPFGKKFEKTQLPSKKWERAETFAKVLALSALLFLGNSELKAQEAGKEKVSERDKHELLIKTRMFSDSLYRKLIGLKGGLSGVNPYGTLSFIEETTGYKVSFVVGNAEHPYSTFLETHSGSARLRYIDEDADGKIERVLENAEQGDDLHKDMDDAKIGFKSVKEITGDSDLAQTLVGKDITVFELKERDGEQEVQIVGFKENARGNFSGKDAEKFINTIQGVYANDLESMIKK